MGPSQGAISAVPFRLSRLGLSLFLCIFLQFRSHTEAHPRCHSCCPISFVKARTFISPMIFLAFSPLILKPTQGAMSAVPPPSSKLGLLFFLRFSSNFASYIEGQSRCHFCGTVSFVKARTLNFLLGFSCNIASHTEARSRCHCCGTVSFVKARAFTLPKGFPAFFASHTEAYSRCYFCGQFEN